MDSFFNSKNIIDILLKWKFQLGLVVAAAILLSVFFSIPMFITPLYKSNCLLYPSNISPYSDESVTEQAVQIFQSRDIRDSLVKKFDLAKHWGIDSGDKHFESFLGYEYGQRVSINKTPYDAVEIDIWDQDPVMARDIAYAIVDAFNVKMRAMHKEKFGEVVLNYQYILDIKNGYLDSLKTRSTELSTKYGLLEYGNQTKEVMRAYLSGGRSTSSEVIRLKKNLEEKGAEALGLRDLMADEANTFSIMKQDADKALFNYNRSYSYVNLLSKPFVPDKKAYPIRWLIVVFSTLATFFLAILIIGLIERSRFSSIIRVGRDE
jgi:hypothetical protein